MLIVYKFERPSLEGRRPAALGYNHGLDQERLNHAFSLGLESSGMKFETASGIRLYLRLLRYVVPYKRIFILSILAMAVYAATDPALAALMKPLLDGTLIEQDPDALVQVPLLFLGVFLVRGLAAFSSGFSIHWVANKVLMDLRAEMFERLVALPASFYNDNPSGTLISKFTYDVAQINTAATYATLVLVRDSLAVLGLLAFMFYVDWFLALIALISAPVVVLIVRYFSNRLRTMSRNLQGSMGELTHFLEEAIKAHKIIKVYGGQQEEIGRFRHTINWARRYTMKFVTAAVATGPSVQFISAVVLALIIYVAALQSAAGKLSVGDFVSFFGALALLMGPLRRLVKVNESLQPGLAACESIFGLLDQETERDTGTQVIARAKGKVEFRQVSLRYARISTDALTDISIRIRAGETLALVGASGSGKTTFVNLIPRFFEATSGRIMLDGVDIRDITLASLRANIGLVSQEVVLFNDTIRNNIAYGALHEADDQSIVKAAEAAHAMEFIRQKPEGIDTLIGEDGVMLSGGQRQRLAIARALLKDAPILILDEATSSLDATSERHIQAALESLKRNRTCIIIAHRLSTIENAERIVVMQKGRIVETGTHSELLRQNGVYASLYRVQFANDVEPPDSARVSAR